MDRKGSSNNWASAFMCQWWQWVILVYSGVSDRQIHIQFVLSLQPEAIFRIMSEKFWNNMKITNRKTTEHWVSIIFTLSRFTGIFLHKCSRSKGCLHSKNWEYTVSYYRVRERALLITLAKHSGLAAPRTDPWEGTKNKKSKAHCPTSAESHCPLCHGQQPPWHLP